MSDAKLTNSVFLLMNIDQTKLEGLKAFLKSQYDDHKADPTKHTFMNVVGTLHFDRYVIMPGEKQVVFASHFDGELQPYLDDFWRYGKEGFQKVLSFMEGYPEGGIQTAVEFTNFLLPYLLEQQFVFSIYEGVTVKEIHKALKVKEQFSALLDNFA